MNKKSRISPETRAKLSESKRGSKNPNWGKRLSIETRAKMSMAKMGKKRPDRLGIPLSSETKTKISHALKGRNAGQLSPFWKGGRFRDGYGYVQIFVPAHPAANARGYVLEHRLVMEEYLGRPLLPTEVVHHKNENREDNQRENLRLFASRKDHLRYHERQRRAVKQQAAQRAAPAEVFE